MRILMVMFMLFASVSCMAEPEEMMQVNREYDRQKMVEMFVSENVPYKIVNENQIYYPVSYRDKVKKIREAVWGPADNSKKGVSVKAEIAPMLAAELVRNGIPYSVNFSEDSSVFTWNAHYNKSAMSIVHDVVP